MSHGNTLQAKKSYDRISPTAWLIAEARTFSDIPYSREIFDALGKISKPERSLAEGYPRAMFCRLEARYKLVNLLIAEQDTLQILELASGFSPRGLSMTQAPAADYVEIDLPGIISQKRQIFAIIKQIPPQNLHLESGSALDRNDILRAVRYFNRGKKIIVINEGLLRYLSFDEKKAVAANVATLLKKFGGVWITPDVTVSVFTRRESIVEKTKYLTGVDVSKNTFENMEEAKAFFENLGFSVEVHKFSEVKESLVSPAKFGLSENNLDDVLRDGHAFVMRLKC
jgi:O-methyltransferase involved in polyketide biosynthesis